MNTIFLILHYNEIELTAKAIESIRVMKSDEEHTLSIVVVDNCSPNGSGKELVKRYACSCNDVADGCASVEEGKEKSADVMSIHRAEGTVTGEAGGIGLTIILNTENGGFAKGNNIGYRYIRRNMSADFIVALNNDITFPQRDFLYRLESVYHENEEASGSFYLAGPDVYTPHIRSHISPLAAKARNRGDIIRMMKVNEGRIADFTGRGTLTSYTRYLQDKYQSSPLLRIYNGIRHRQYDGALAHDVPAYGCVLNGACLIFDVRYIEEYDCLFEEETFLYAEEDFLTLRLTRAGEAIRYSPELLVSHVGQGSSGYTRTRYRQYCEKNIKSLKLVNQAFEIYLKKL